jgi:hypothetical protein
MTEIQSGAIDKGLRGSVEIKTQVAIIHPAVGDVALRSINGRTVWIENLRREIGNTDHERSCPGSPTQPNINNAYLEQQFIGVPSLPEQREIVRLLDEQFTVIEQNEREIDAALKRSAALRQSILKKAFTGQLVPQDPTDEPASTLLERIREERQIKPAKPKKRAI